MRSNLEGPASRVLILAGALAIFSSACGGGGGGGGTGGRTGTGGKAPDGGGQGGLRMDGGAGGATPDAAGFGGRMDGGAGTDGGAGGRMDGGAGGASIDGGAGGQGVTDGGVGGAGGPDGGPLGLPWHAFLPLGMAAPGSVAAMGTLTDSTSNHYDATYFGTTISFTNAAMNLTGLGSELVLVSAKNGVPAIDVTGSYSVSVWTTLANPGGYRTVVAGEGVNVASFYLQKRADTNAWAFTVFPTDSTVGPACVVPGLVDGGTPPNGITPIMNTQYHLVATRDATTNLNVLYVNGVESAHATCLAGWADTGILGVGHGIFGGGRGDNVQGSIAELGVINRVLTAAEVAAIFAAGRAGTIRPDAGTDASDAGAASDAPADAPVTEGGAGADAPASDAPASDAASDTAADGG